MVFQVVFYFKNFVNGKLSSSMHCRINSFFNHEQRTTFSYDILCPMVNSKSFIDGKTAVMKMVGLIYFDLCCSTSVSFFFLLLPFVRITLRSMNLNSTKISIESVRPRSSFVRASSVISKKIATLN
jgi:hypothetical protein